jgi:hypothetical protein
MPKSKNVTLILGQRPPACPVAAGRGCREWGQGERTCLANPKSALAGRQASLFQLLQQHLQGFIHRVVDVSLGGMVVASRAAQGIQQQHGHSKAMPQQKHAVVSVQQLSSSAQPRHFL